MTERTKEFQDFLDNCADGNFLNVLLYVKSGNSFTGENNLGLSLAIVNNHLEITKYLMSKGANPFMTNTLPPIIEACESGLLKMVRYLWTARYNYVAEYKDKNNKESQKCFEESIMFNCLDASLKSGKSSLINFWLDKGAKIQHNFEHLNVSNSNPVAYNGLDILCQRGHIKALNKIVESGKADIHFNNTSHLLAAANEKDYDIIKYLLDKGCDSNLLKNDKYKDILVSIEREDFAIRLDLKIKNIITPSNNNKNKI